MMSKAAEKWQYFRDCKPQKRKKLLKKDFAFRIDDIGAALPFIHRVSACGDHIDIVEQGADSTVIVLADGLGSGVKASELHRARCSFIRRRSSQHEGKGKQRVRVHGRTGTAHCVSFQKEGKHIY